jgi:hypothetical protein
MSEPRGRNLAIDVGLRLQVFEASIAFSINRKGNVHLGDVDLHAETVKRPILEEMDAASASKLATCICNPTPSMGTPRCRKSRTRA